MNKAISSILCVLLLSACDNGVPIWQGTTIFIEAPGEKRVGKALSKLVAYLGPSVEPVAQDYKDGRWAIRTRNDLPYGFKKSFARYLEIFGESDSAVFSMKGVEYHFDSVGDVELGKEAGSIIDSSPYPFFIAEGVIPRMERSDYRMSAPSTTLQSAMNKSYAICYLEIPIVGDGVPHGWFANVFSLQSEDSGYYQNVIDSMNKAAAPRSAPLPGRVMSKDGSPVEVMRDLIPHPHEDDKLVFYVDQWSTGSRFFAGDASECFDRENGEDALRIIGQIGFPQLVGHDMKLLF